MAIANLGFSQGVHYWEIICPSKCIGVEVGIIKNWGETPFAEINKKDSVTSEFNTSTARTLCLRLNLHVGQLEVWIKEAPEKSLKTQKIEKA